MICPSLFGSCGGKCYPERPRFCLDIRLEAVSQRDTGRLPVPMGHANLAKPVASSTWRSSILFANATV